MKKMLLLLSVFLSMMMGCMPSSDTGHNERRKENQRQHKQENIETATADASVPADARAVVTYAKGNNWRAQPGYVGGREFENREHRLPLKGDPLTANSLSFKEYDVNPKQHGQGRDAERVIIALNSGVFYKVYYTADHYRTFNEIK